MNFEKERGKNILLYEMQDYLLLLWLVSFNMHTQLQET